MVIQENLPEIVSLDALIEEGFDIGAEDRTAEEAISSVDLERILQRLQKVNPEYVRLAALRAEGYTMDEIASIMHLSRATVYRYREQIRNIVIWDQ